MMRAVLGQMPWMRSLAFHVLKHIRKGVGAGLRFDPAGTNFDYVMGTNETPVQNTLARVTKMGDVFYDIGANVGFFTMIGAKLVGATGAVYAFEPVPYLARAVHQNACRNRFWNVNIIEYAVADRVGTDTLQLTAHPGGATLSSTGVRPADVVEEVPVNLMTIDAWVADGRLKPPNVVKIDVEGAEEAVLKGMIHTLLAHRPTVIYEIDDLNEASYVQRRAQLMSFFTRIGYQVYHLADSYAGAASFVGHAVALPNPVAGQN